ncbi:MAG: response regulator [Verrucomicrobiota bacterium]
MFTPLRVLIVEDSVNDAELVIRELRQSGYQTDWKRVETEDDFTAALELMPDLIISDYTMPQFNGMRAFEILKEKNLPIPFIFVSGTLGEEAAVEAMKRGVADYLVKGRISRLGVAVQQALDQVLTQKKLAEALQLLQENEERFCLLSENIHEAFWIMNPHEKRMIYVSPAYDSIWGRPRESLYESMEHWFYPIHLEDISSVKAFAQRSQRDGIHHVEFRITRPDGQERWIHNKAFPVFTESKTIDRIVGVASDITDQKLLDGKKRQLEAQLFQSQKMELLGTVSGGVAHDFNNILTPILGYSEMALEDPQCPPQFQNYILEIRRAGLIAKDLVQRLLTFTRFHKPEKKTVNLSHVIADSVQLLRSTLPSTIQINLHLPSQCSLTVADPIQVYQILLNLGTNAAHAMSSNDGLLEINLEELEFTAVQPVPNLTMTYRHYFAITVKDNGSGIDESIIKQIFDPFFTTKKCGEGTGLGLSIVQSMIQAHEGAITIKSSPRQGSVFTIYLPIIPTEEVQTEPCRIDQIIKGNGENILIVDDHEAIGTMVQSSLTKMGYQARHISSNDSLLSDILKNISNFDLVITDQTMPKITGMDLIRKIRKTNETLPVVLMTGYSNCISMQELDALKNTTLLKKPFELQELARLLRVLFTQAKAVSF